MSNRDSSVCEYHEFNYSRADTLQLTDEALRLDGILLEIQTDNSMITLSPHEDLKALAKRVTGDEKNWSAIAKDNGLASATDVTPFQNVWVRNSLLKPVLH